VTLIQTPRAARPVICGGAALPPRPTDQLNPSAAEDPIGPGSHQPVRAPQAAAAAREDRPGLHHLALRASRRCGHHRDLPSPVHPGRWSSHRPRRACSISTRTIQRTSCQISSAEWRRQQRMLSTRQYQRWKWHGHATHCANSPMATTSTASRDRSGRICRDADRRSRSVSASRAYAVIDRRLRAPYK
jgi:hypothetical protein